LNEDELIKRKIRETVRTDSMLKHLILVNNGKPT